MPAEHARDLVAPGDQQRDALDHDVGDHDPARTVRDQPIDRDAAALRQGGDAGNQDAASAPVLCAADGHISVGVVLKAPHIDGGRPARERPDKARPLILGHLAPNAPGGELRDSGHRRAFFHDRAQLRGLERRIVPGAHHGQDIGDGVLDIGLRRRFVRGRRRRGDKAPDADADRNRREKAVQHRHLIPMFCTKGNIARRYCATVFAIRSVCSFSDISCPGSLCRSSKLRGLRGRVKMGFHLRGTVALHGVCALRPTPRTAPAPRPDPRLRAAEEWKRRCS